MLIDPESLPDNPAELRTMNRLLAAEVKALTLKVEQLQHQLTGHNRHRFGTKSESLDQLQLSLAEDEEIAVAAERVDTPEPEAASPKTKPRRKPGHPYLPRQEAEFLIQWP